MNLTGVSLAVENCGARPLKIELDCSSSVNAVSNRLVDNQPGYWITGCQMFAHFMCHVL